MHATIAQLLDIKDGQQSALRDHVGECKQCQIALAQLQLFESKIGLSMFDAADKVPSNDVWLRIQNSLDQANAEQAELNNGKPQASAQIASNVHKLAFAQQPSLSKAIYALAASIAFVGVVSIFMFSQQQNSQTQILQASLNELMLNSRGLEHVLHRVADQNQALSVASQKAADRLYWRLTNVDQLINQASPENTERMEVLWSNRIEALNALNQIYYQQESTLNTSEI